MTNPLVRLGIKTAVKGGKKLAKKIKTRTNSTNNINTGPIDRAIDRVDKITKESKRILGNLEKNNIVDNSLQRLLRQGISKGQTLKNELGFKRLHKKMGIK